MKEKRSRSRTKPGVVAGTIFVLAFAILAWAAPVHALVTTTTGTGFHEQTGDETASPLVTQGQVIGLVSMLYANLEAQGVTAGSLAPAQTLAASVVNLFQLVSIQPAFSSLYSADGSGAFSVQFGGQVTQPVTMVYFVFNSINGRTTSTSTWEGDLSTMSISGPVSTVRPTFDSNTFYSVNWAGSSWWGSGSPSPTLGMTNADEAYPTVSKSSAVPQNVPPGKTVDQLASVWTGLTDTNTYLLQTGFYTNATAGWNYGHTFYELACGSGHSCPSGAYNFGSGLQHVSFGDSVFEEVEDTGLWTTWGLYVEDFTTGTYALAGLTVTQWLGSNGFTPQWTQFIVEAPTVAGVIQQIPDFTQVKFCDATYSSTSQTWTTYGQANNQYQLEQASSNYNTNQGYANQHCGHYNTYGAPTVSWVNSNYNYNYV